VNSIKRYILNIELEKKEYSRTYSTKFSQIIRLNSILQGNGKRRIEKGSRRG
jgi:hypothetical protein